MIIIKTKQEQNILQIPKLKPLNLELWHIPGLEAKFRHKQSHPSSSSEWKFLMLWIQSTM